MKNGAPSFKLCGCLMDASSGELPAILSHSDVDLVEWRLDSLIKDRGLKGASELLSLLPSIPPIPMIATNRHKLDGGFFEGSDEERIGILAGAAEAGFHWIDLEERLDGDVYRRFQATGKRILISHHDFTGTPPALELRGKLEKMARAKPDAIKIVTLAHAQEDNLRVLELISFGKRELGVDVIAFCMGPVGRWTRGVSLLLGSPWAYVRMADQGEAAPGQYTAREMRSLMGLLSDFHS
jgi:3-dehydroquinate dehydratase type I